jgi:hypothetical protein
MNGGVEKEQMEPALLTFALLGISSKLVCNNFYFNLRTIKEEMSNPIVEVDLFQDAQVH